LSLMLLVVCAPLLLPPASRSSRTPNSPKPYPLKTLSPALQLV
jgi:hypothetical protein